MITAGYALGIGMKQKTIKPRFNGEKNEGHEDILKDLSFQYSDCHPEKEFALQIRLYKNINISVVEERLCYHNFFNLAEKKEQNINCRKCAGGLSVL